MPKKMWKSVSCNHGFLLTIAHVGVRLFLRMNGKKETRNISDCHIHAFDSNERGNTMEMTNAQLQSSGFKS
jgi:hypothetical protein